MANLTSPYASSDTVAVGQAVSQVVERGQRLLADRLDLAQLELKLGLQDAAERGVMLMGAGMAMGVGFVVFTYGLVQWLQNWMSAGSAALLVGMTYIITGAGAWHQGAHRKPAHKGPVVQ